MPDITRDVLRKWRSGGIIKGIRSPPNSHPRYFAHEIKKVLGLEPEEPPHPTSVPERARLAPLLRLRDVEEHIGFKRDEVEDLVRTRQIKPFFKHNSAKALYRTWQFKKLVGRGDDDPPKIRSEPPTPYLRRAAASKWLGVTNVEIESWVRPCGWIHRKTFRGKGYYDRDEIKRKILALPKRKNASKTRDFS